MKKRYILLIFIAILIVIFLLGPRPNYPQYDGRIASSAIPLEDLEEHLKIEMSKIEGLKSNNDSYIQWADSVRKTPYAVVFLHGFSASPKEGEPIANDFAKRYGCNLYMPLLAGHGIDDRLSFSNLTPKDLIESAKEAIAIGQLLGEKVIVASSSTGGTLSLYLAALNPASIDAMLLYSPNIDLYDPTSMLMTMPWGTQLAKSALGETRKIPGFEGEITNYWTSEYAVEGLVCLKYLIQETMTPEILTQVKQPFFLGYYYKNEEEQDKTVSVKAMENFYKIAQTPADKKTKYAFPNGKHVLTSSYQTENLDKVAEKTYEFAEKVLGLKPVE